MAKIVVFELLKWLNLISHKIWVAVNFLNFYNLLFVAKLPISETLTLRYWQFLALFLSNWLFHLLQSWKHWKLMLCCIQKGTVKWEVSSVLLEVMIFAVSTLKGLPVCENWQPWIFHFCFRPVNHQKNFFMIL